MPVQRLNHAVLYVRNVPRSATFYGEALGFQPVDRYAGVRGATFLRAPGSTNDHDLGLFQLGEQAADSPAGRTAVGLYHLAWEVDTLDELDRIKDRLIELGALVGASDHGTTKALYAKDPDNIEFEVSWLVPADQLTERELTGPGVAPLNLALAKAQYGATTKGGVGVSTPV
jgi:catechol-2,3-dioxygenase